MTDKFHPLPIDGLLKMILQQYSKTGFIFGIPDELFFRPKPDDTFRMKRFGQLLESPVGVAAGPHTQLSQNIVAAWLTGARFIELKTIQTLDNLEISKPCIDMQDEGYNCEWSQELKVQQSFDQYLDAWILIHILKDYLKIGTPDETGFVFNISVGYNLEGILNANVQWFLDQMHDASAAISEKLDSIRNIYPKVDKLAISPQISDNVTLSTMHGCPPDEIEKIGDYLLSERKLHTAIKLNPTLLGKEPLTDIMEKTGFDTIVPDEAFEHDLKYDDALDIINNLQSLAKSQNLQFSLKLTNTLESKNHKHVFDANQDMMYMSGRALHPLSVNLAARLQKDYTGNLDISFSGGADAFNIVGLVKSGLAPVTVCTDLLKPGGYGRLAQYIEKLREVKVNRAHDFQQVAPFRGRGNQTIENQAYDTSFSNFLEDYAKQVISNPDYRKDGLKEPSIKTDKPLANFDCIHAPCEFTCPTGQDIPAYLHHVSQGNLEAAARVVTDTNPFPQSTGMVCDHLCQTKCTRINYDSPLLIREVKRMIAEKAPKESLQAKVDKKPGKNLKAAIIGAGPSGLSCAYFLRKAGFEVLIFESKPKPGGMVSGAIPAFRLPDNEFGLDVARITGMGIAVHYNTKIDRNTFDELKSENDFVYIAAGAQKSRPLPIEGINADGVRDPLQFLFDVKSGSTEFSGKQVVIIGGGNTAMDASRTAWRLVGENGKVTIAYRRKIMDMPADLGEIKAVMEEGVEIMEMVAPVKVNVKNGRIFSLTLRRMKTGPPDASGRARPVEIPGSDFQIPADTIIPAIGQDLAIDLPAEALQLNTRGNFETQIPGVFIGGDAMRGASTAINAIGDGRKAAQEIIHKAGVDFQTKSENSRPHLGFRQHILEKTKRVKGVAINETEPSKRRNFNLVQTPLTAEEAVTEAARCLKCDEVCSICTTVCPNMALATFEIDPFKTAVSKIKYRDGKTEITDDGVFELSQTYQIIHIADWCNQCGNCNTFCPTAGAPYLDKPHLYLDKNAWAAENDGFYLEGETLLGRIGKQEFSLQRKNGGYQFETPEIKINLDDRLKIEDYEITGDNSFEVDLQFAATMKIVLDGAQSLNIESF